MHLRFRQHPRRQFNHQVGVPARWCKQPLCLELLEDRVLLNAGALDPTFGTSGIVTTSFPLNTQAQATAVAIQSDGKIVVAGAALTGSSDSIALARYNPGGSLDPGFGTGGQVIIPSTTSISVAALALQADGKI